MIGKEQLKQLFHEVSEAKPELKEIENFDTLLVKAYNYLDDVYYIDDKAVAKELSLCLWYEYGFLYK